MIAAITVVILISAVSGYFIGLVVGSQILEGRNNK